MIEDSLIARLRSAYEAGKGRGGSSYALLNEMSWIELEHDLASHFNTIDLLTLFAVRKRVEAALVLERLACEEGAEARFREAERAATALASGDLGRLAVSITQAGRAYRSYRRREFHQARDQVCASQNLDRMLVGRPGFERLAARALTLAHNHARIEAASGNFRQAACMLEQIVEALASSMDSPVPADLLLGAQGLDQASREAILEQVAGDLSRMVTSGAVPTKHPAHDVLLRISGVPDCKRASDVALVTLAFKSLADATVSEMLIASIERMLSAGPNAGPAGWFVALNGLTTLARACPSQSAQSLASDIQAHEASARRCVAR